MPAPTRASYYPLRSISPVNGNNWNRLLQLNPHRETQQQPVAAATAYYSYNPNINLSASMFGNYLHANPAGHTLPPPPSWNLPHPMGAANNHPRSHHYQHHHRHPFLPPRPHPQPHSYSQSQVQPNPTHIVWILDCKSCGTFFTNRGMKAVLLLRPAVSLFSTDALPINCSAYSTNPGIFRPDPSSSPFPAASNSNVPLNPLPPPQPDPACECLTQTLCCHGCGTAVGYMIVLPCSRCTSSITPYTNRCTNGHRFVFHAAEIEASERRYIPGEPGVNINPSNNVGISSMWSSSPTGSEAASSLFSPFTFSPSESSLFALSTPESIPAPTEYSASSSSSIPTTTSESEHSNTDSDLDVEETIPDDINAQRLVESRRPIVSQDVTSENGSLAMRMAILMGSTPRPQTPSTFPRPTFIRASEIVEAGGRQGGEWVEERSEGREGGRRTSRRGGFIITNDNDGSVTFMSYGNDINSDSPEVQGLVSNLDTRSDADSGGGGNTWLPTQPPSSLQSASMPSLEPVSPMVGPVPMQIPVLSSAYPHPAQFQHLSQQQTSTQTQPTLSRETQAPSLNPNSNNSLSHHVPAVVLLRGGDVLYWHHLKRSGEIPGVCEDERARSGARAITFRDRFTSRTREGSNSLNLKRGSDGGSLGNRVGGEQGKRKGDGFLVMPVGMVIGGR